MPSMQTGEFTTTMDTNPCHLCGHRTKYPKIIAYQCHCHPSQYCNMKYETKFSPNKYSEAKWDAHRMKKETQILWI